MLINYNKISTPFLQVFQKNTENSSITFLCQGHKRKNYFEAVFEQKLSSFWSRKKPAWDQENSSFGGAKSGSGTSWTLKYYLTSPFKEERNLKKINK